MVSIWTVRTLNFRQNKTIQTGLELYTLQLNPPSTSFSPSSAGESNFSEFLWAKRKNANKKIRTTQKFFLAKAIVPIHILYKRANE